MAVDFPFNTTEPGRVAVVASVLVPFALMATLALAVRVYSCRILRRKLGLDDWSMLVAWGFVLAISATAGFCIPHGLVHPPQDVPLPDTETLLRAALAMKVLFVAGVSLTKASICLKYLELFRGRTNAYFCRAAIAYSACYFVAFAFVWIFQCQPVADFIFIAKAHRSCFSERPLMIATGALNSLSDFAVYLWPAHILWRMKLPQEKRLALIGLFSFGFVLSMLGLIRVCYFTTELTWPGARAALFFAVEADLGIVCGCMPCCKPAVVKLSPCLFKNKNPPSRLPSVSPQRPPVRDPYSVLEMIEMTVPIIYPDDAPRVLMHPPPLYGNPGFA